MKVAYIDTETTGLDPHVHEMIEIAIIRDGVEWSSRIRPVRLEVAQQEALAVNGYSPERWADAPLLEDVAEEIVTRLDGCTLLCGHNVAFDRSFVLEGLARCGVSTEWFPWRTLDTQTLAYEHLVPCGLASLSLDAIREYLGWSLDGAHSALQDARDVQRLWESLARSTWCAPWR